VVNEGGKNLVIVGVKKWSSLLSPTLYHPIKAFLSPTTFAAANVATAAEEGLQMKPLEYQKTKGRKASFE
jgi:hypothetical protein